MTAKVFKAEQLFKHVEFNEYAYSTKACRKIYIMFIRSQLKYALVLVRSIIMTLKRLKNCATCCTLRFAFSGN